MEIGTIIKTLQDPMGIPFYPVVFPDPDGADFCASHHVCKFYCRDISSCAIRTSEKDKYWTRLSKAMAKAVSANVSIAMLLGVAPLLFVQVVYDPFWYASNSLSAAWVIGFIAIMMAAYSSAYVFYLGREKKEGRGFAFFGVLAVGLFIMSGVIMHALSYQLLQPEKWLQWYIKGNAVDTSGTSLHAFQLPRFLHFIIPSFAMTGIFLMLYAWYFKERADMEKGYLEWVGRTGAKMAFNFTAVQAAVGFWWLLSLPGEFSFLQTHFS